MAGEVKKVIQLEIGHVLFIDIVGYSKLLIATRTTRISRMVFKRKFSHGWQKSQI